MIYSKTSLASVSKPIFKVQSLSLDSPQLHIYLSSSIWNSVHNICMDAPLTSIVLCNLCAAYSTSSVPYGNQTWANLVVDPVMTFII